MAQIIVKSDKNKNIVNILKKSVEREKLLLKIAICQAQEELSRFEKQYNMETNSFIRKFRQGFLGDNPDFIEWSGEKEIFDRLKKQFSQMREINFAY